MTINFQYVHMAKSEAMNQPLTDKVAAEESEKKRKYAQKKATKNLKIR